MHRALVFEANGGRLAGQLHDGDGPTVVALHAGVAGRRSWQEVIPHLGDAARIIS